jgi:hypothetical protein
LVLFNIWKTLRNKESAQNKYNWLQYLTPEELKLEFNKCELHVTEQYENVAGSDFLPDGDEFAIVAKKSQ